MPGRKQTDATRAKISQSVKSTLEQKRQASNPTRARAKELHDHFQASTPEKISPRVRNHGDLGRDVVPYTPPPRQLRGFSPQSDLEIQAKADELGVKRGKERMKETEGVRASPQPARVLTNPSQDRQAALRNKKGQMNAAR